MEFLLVMVAAVAVILIVSAPFRRLGADARETQGAGPSAQVAELQAARDAKYREIRDAELDHRTGKLSDEDFSSLDGTLRAEAISILQALDRAQKKDRGFDGPSGATIEP